MPPFKVKELRLSENKKGKLLSYKSPESIFAAAPIILRVKKNAGIDHSIFKWEFTTSYFVKLFLHTYTSSKRSDLETRHAATMMHNTADIR